MCDQAGTLSFAFPSPAHPFGFQSACPRPTNPSKRKPHKHALSLMNIYKIWLLFSQTICQPSFFFLILLNAALRLKVLKPVSRVTWQTRSKFWVGAEGGLTATGCWSLGRRCVSIPHLPAILPCCSHLGHPIRFKCSRVSPVINPSIHWLLSSFLSLVDAGNLFPLVFFKKHNSRCLSLELHFSDLRLRFSSVTFLSLTFCTPAAGLLVTTLGMKGIPGAKIIEVKCYGRYFVMD